jgi:hypothetical protein
VDRNFSSSATFLYKFIIPPFWIALCGLLVVQYSQLSHPIGPFGNEAMLAFVLLTIVGSVFYVRFCLTLLRVQLRDGRLYASNYSSEIEIRPSDIADVTQSIWVKLRPITIHLRAPSEFGQRLRFMPPMRIIFRFWIRDPIVEELRAFARHPAVDPWALE